MNPRFLAEDTQWLFLVSSSLIWRQKYLSPSVVERVKEKNPLASVEAPAGTK